MASRRFDCYIPGGDNTLPSFIKSLANGRIVIFTIRVSVLKSVHIHDDFKIRM